MLSQKTVARLVMILAVVTAGPGSAAGTPSKSQCGTACHQPQNIVRAHMEKRQSPLCRECHQGVLPVTAKSPFVPMQRIMKISAPAKQKRSSASAKKTPPSPGKGKYPDMASVRGGEFVMGSNERWDDEAPEHIASTGAFYIDLHEVTNKDYKKFAEATQRETPYHWPNGEIPNGKQNHPVVYVSWFDARDYCQWTGKRLPTEQEWEKAARGEEGNIYPWGNEWSLDKSNNPYKYSTGTEPVRSYPKGRSPYGLYDMSGNVWEWVDSFYLPHPGNTVHRAEYGKDKRILKGGSWFDCLSYGCGLSAPTFNRSFFTPEVRNNSFGFRCAKSDSPTASRN